MDEQRRYLSESMERLSLKGEEAKAILRRLLQTLADGAALTQFRVATVIFGAADSAPENEKRLFYASLFDGLMRALEEFAMLCLMGWDESRHPLDIYLNLDKPEVRAFYARARKGLGEEVIFRLVGVANLTQIKRMPVFQGQDFSRDEDALDWQVQDAREMLMRFGKLYHTTPEDADDEIGAWQMALLKTSIGQKLLLSPEGEPPLMLLGIEQADPAKPAPSTAFLAKVQPGAHFAERVLQDIDTVCRQMQRLAARRLALLDDVAAAAKAANQEYKDHLKELAVKPKENPAPAAPETQDAVHEETRHDRSTDKVLEVGGLKIHHSKQRSEE